MINWSPQDRISRPPRSEPGSWLLCGLRSWMETLSDRWHGFVDGHKRYDSGGKVSVVAVRRIVNICGSDRFPPRS